VRSLALGWYGSGSVFDFLQCRLRNFEILPAKLGLRLLVEFLLLRLFSSENWLVVLQSSSETFSILLRQA
jgi:hypothetical protein